MMDTRRGLICSFVALTIAIMATILMPQQATSCLLGMNRELARSQLMSLLGQYPDLLNGQQNGGMYGQGQGMYGNQRLPNGQQGMNGMNGLNGQQNGMNGMNGQNGLGGLGGQQGLNGLNGQQGMNGMNGLNGQQGMNGMGGYMG